MGATDVVGNLAKKLARLRKVLKKWEIRVFGNIMMKELNEKIGVLERKEDDKISIQQMHHLIQMSGEIENIHIKEEIM